MITGTSSLPTSRPHHHSSAILRVATDFQYRVGKLAPFGLLTFVAILNLNGLTAMLLGVSRVLSVLILIGCVGTFVAFGFAFRESLGRVGAWFFAFLLTYLSIGLVGGFANPQNIQFVMLESTATMLVVCASAMAARYCLLTYSFRGLIRWLFFLSLFTAALIFLSMRTRIFYTFYTKGMDETRYSGTFANPNESGFAMCIGLCIGFSYLIFAKRKIIVAVGIVSIAVAMAVSFSRAAYLITALLVAFQILFSPIVKRKMFALVLCLLAASFTWLVFVGAKNSDLLTLGQRKRLEYLSTMLTTGEIQSEGSGRAELTEEAIEMCKEAPAFGHGMGSMQRMPRQNLGCHNTYLMVMGESGLGGLIMLLCFLAVFAYEGWKCPSGPLRTLVLSYLIVLSLSFMFSHNIFGNRNQNVMIGTCFGIMAGAKELQRRNQIKQSGNHGEPRIANCN